MTDNENHHTTNTVHGAPEALVQARQAWGAALDYFRDHGDPRAPEVVERLRDLES